MRMGFLRLLLSSTATSGRCAATLCCPIPHRMPVCFDAHSLQRRPKALTPPRITDVPLCAGLQAVSHWLRHRFSGVLASIALTAIVIAVVVGMLFVATSVLPSPAANAPVVHVANPILTTAGLAVPGMDASQMNQERELETRANQILAELESEPHQAENSVTTVSLPSH